LDKALHELGDTVRTSASLTQLLTLTLKDSMAIVNPPYKEILSEEDLIMICEDEESNKKV
jgi:hypothetical protein